MTRRSNPVKSTTDADVLSGDPTAQWRGDEQHGVRDLSYSSHPPLQSRHGQHPQYLGVIIRRRYLGFRNARRDRINRDTELPAKLRAAKKGISVKNHQAEAVTDGHVVGGGHYLQRPGISERVECRFQCGVDGRMQTHPG